MRDLHPTQSAGTGESVEIARKIKGPNEKAETIIECPHCGFRYDKNRDSRPDPNEGGVANVQISISLQSGGTKTFTEGQRVSGCPLCGHDAERSTYRQPFYSTKNLAGR